MPPLVWVLSDERPGNANQALGVAEALGWPFVRREIRCGPLARLPNAVLGSSTLGLRPECRTALAPPWPALVIAAGRRAAPVVRWLKRRHPRGFFVQLMWPGSARGFDLIAVPAHDDVPDGPRILKTPGAPHRLTPAALAAAAEALAPRIAHLPRPYVVCLVGGTSKGLRFSPEDAATLAGKAGALAARRGGSLLITTSRRTGGDCEQAIEQTSLPAPVWLHRFSDGGDNPYAGLLGLADALVVSADSASMCTEACAAGRPVFLYRPRAGVRRKHARLHARLERAGHLRPLGAPWPERVPPPLCPQTAVAEVIRARLPWPVIWSRTETVASAPPTA